jgi:hypothetical protein
MHTGAPQYFGTSNPALSGNLTVAFFGTWNSAAVDRTLIGRATSKVPTTDAMQFYLLGNTRIVFRVRDFGLGYTQVSCPTDLTPFNRHVIMACVGVVDGLSVRLYWRDYDKDYAGEATTSLSVGLTTTSVTAQYNLVQDANYQSEQGGHFSHGFVLDHPYTPAEAWDFVNNPFNIFSKNSQRHPNTPVTTDSGIIIPPRLSQGSFINNTPKVRVDY